MVATLPVAHKTHTLRLQGLTNPASGEAPTGQPTLIQRTEQDFLEVLFQELQEQNWAAIENSLANRVEDGLLSLYQPVHQVFHLVLLEAVCDPYGRPELRPRLDPKKIESAGLVIRRLAQPATTSAPADLELNSVSAALQSPLTSNTLLGWRKANTVDVGAVLKGWIPFTDGYQATVDLPGVTQPGTLSQTLDWNLDPLPQHRQLPQVGHSEVDRQRWALFPPPAPYAETYSPLFVAPPAVCEALGKTVLYGLVPLSSAEVSEIKLGNPDTNNPLSAPREQASTGGYRPDFVRDQLPMYLKASAKRTMPLAGKLLTPEDADQILPVGDPKANDEQRNLRVFVNLLRQLQIQLGVFRDSSEQTPEAKALFDLLETIRFPVNDDPQEGVYSTAGRFLEAAARVLIDRQEQESVKAVMPAEWPKISSQLAKDILTATKAILDQQLKVIVPQQPRFADPEARYRLRAFMRVRRPDPCPPQLVWSEHSQPFKILAWYENGPLPPVQVQLPDITRDSVKKLKPNVTFAVPGHLFNLLQANKPKDLLEGNGKPLPEGVEVAFDWICGFNIPIITFCAFLLLTIILNLLNIIFWWLPYIYICIPFPKSKRFP